MSQDARNESRIGTDRLDDRKRELHAYAEEANNLHARFVAKYGEQCFTEDRAFVQRLLAIAREEGIEGELGKGVFIAESGNSVPLARGPQHALTVGSFQSGAIPERKVTGLFSSVWGALKRHEAEGGEGLPDFGKLKKLLAFFQKYLESERLRDLEVSPSSLTKSSRPEKTRDGEAPEGKPTSSPAATTTDLARFPEDSSTAEVTSLLVPDAAQPPGKSTPTPGPVAGEGTAPARQPLPSFDPQIEIQKRLGSGGMGEVFLGVQKHLGRQVAVKRIRELGDDEKSAQRFVHEAKAQSMLHHPAIAQVYDLRESQGEHFLIMEYVQGKTLDEVIQIERKLPPDRIVKIAVALTEALETAQHEGYIHRDLKPGNVMLTEDGKVKIIDFGLAYKFRSLMKARFTETGEIRGTPCYMSPEQLNEEDDLEIRSDIWSLGALLYTLATGEPPFTGKDFVCTVKNVMLSEPTPLTILEKDFPPGLWNVIATAMRKERGDRWQDYASFRHALLNYKESGSGTPADAPRTPGSRPVLRAAAILIGTLSALLGLSLITGYGPFGSQKTLENRGTSATATAEDAPLHAKPGKADALPDSAKDLASSPERLVPSLTEKPSAKPPPTAPLKEPVALRTKLAGYAVTEEESALVREVLELFTKHRPHLLAKTFGAIGDDLEVLERDRLDLARGAEPSPEKEYGALQLRAASRMVALAQGAMLARLEELRQSREEVSLLLSDQTTKTGVVLAVEKQVITLAVAGGGQVKIPLESILPESLRGQAAPPSAHLALLALSGSAELSFPDIVELSESREELLFWIPVAVRLARLEVEAAGKAAASAKKESLSAPQGVRPAAHLSPQAARVALLSRMLTDKEGDILRLFGHLKPEFELVSRAGKALRHLNDDEYAQVLALGPGTAAFPVAAAILLGRFEAEVEAAHDELHARTGWHGYGWLLFPPEKSLKEQQKYWDLDLEGNGTILQASETERRIAMGKGAKQVPEGVLIRIVHEPKEKVQPAPHWRFLVRSREGAPHYLRFDESSCALFRTRLEAGVADALIARAPLPAKGKAGGERVLALLPLDGNLHVFADGQHVLAVSESDAAIPMQLSLAVTQGKLRIKSVKAKKSPVEEK